MNYGQSVGYFEFAYGHEYLREKYAAQQAEIGALKRLVNAMADRIAKQSDLLPKKAEKRNDNDDENTRDDRILAEAGPDGGPRRTVQWREAELRERRLVGPASADGGGVRAEGEGAESEK